MQLHVNSDAGFALPDKWEMDLPPAVDKLSFTLHLAAQLYNPHLASVTDKIPMVDHSESIVRSAGDLWNRGTNLQQI